MAHVANITIQSSKVDSDLTDYPIFVDLSDMNDEFWNTVSDGGSDIRIFKEDGETELAREIVACDTSAETGEVHFKYSGTLSSSSNTVIQIHADGSSSDYASDSTYGSENVWSDYQAVYHMKESSGDMIDSAGNYDGSYEGSLPTNQTGKIGEAQYFDGNDYASISDLGISTDDISVTGWIYPDSSISENYHLFGNYEGGEWIDIKLYPNKDIAYSVDNDDDICSYKALGVISEDAWNYLGLVYSTSEKKIYGYLDGSEEGTDTHTGDNPDLGTNSYHIGKSRDKNGEYLIGKTDELRIKKGVLSGDWISTEHNNQSSPSTFYTASEPSPATNTTNFFNFF